MKQLLTLLTFSLLISPSFSFANEKSDAHSHHSESDHQHSNQEATAKKIKKDRILVKVKGMVCAFCAQGIEKKFNSLDEVSKTEVNLDKMEVLVHLHPNKSLTEAQIKKIITDSGFNFVGLK